MPVVDNRTKCCGPGLDWAAASWNFLFLSRSLGGEQGAFAVLCPFLELCLVPLLASLLFVSVSWRRSYFLGGKIEGSLPARSARDTWVMPRLLLRFSASRLKCHSAFPLSSPWGNKVTEAAAPAEFQASRSHEKECRAIPNSTRITQMRRCAVTN